MYFHEKYLSIFRDLQAGDKVLRILEIWESGLGVVSIHVFQSVIPVEAYTREACMISALGWLRSFSRNGFSQCNASFRFRIESPDQRAGRPELR